jgi:glutathione S-transferase
MLQYIADQNPTSGLVPPYGTPARYHQMEMLNFIATEIHKTLGGLFNPKITPEWRAALIELFEIRSKVLDSRLAQHPYLMGDEFTAADAYLATVLGWTWVQEVDITHPHLRDYVARIAARPSVVQAMRAEGLIE